MQAGLSKRKLYALRDGGHIELLSRGIYRSIDAGPADVDLLATAIRIPKATLCLTSALARHDLSDDIPQQIDLAIPRGTRAPALNAPVLWHRFDPDAFELGRDPFPIGEGLSIGIYSPERSVIDVFRMRDIQGEDVAIEALKRWLRRKGNQAAALLKMAARFPRALPSLRKALQILA